MYSDPDIDLDFPMPERLRKVIDEIDNIYLKGKVRI